MLSVDLRHALAGGDLTLVYQPVVDIVDGAMVAVEALARWTHPRLGDIAPSEFVGIAERAGLATTLGDWALRTACRQLSRWRAVGDLCVRVNVSGLQLRDPGFPEQVAGVLRDTGIPAEAVGLEITETVWLTDTGPVATNLFALRESGVTLLLDDVGKGYNGLSYLDRFPVFECFKIDKSYIHAAHSPRGRAVLSAMVSLAKAYGTTVIGEGVETDEQLAVLAASGCDLVQGYLCGPPADADHITALLSRRNA